MRLKTAREARTRGAWAAVALTLLLGAPAPTRAGSFDLETANRVVGDYFRHVVEGLPRDWRRAEEEKMRTSPPQLGEHGLFQITAPAGQLAFEYDAERRTLFAYSVIHKPRREYPLIGLSREEILSALEKAAATGVDTGGGEVHWDPVAEGYFLRRAFAESPQSMRKMIKQLDRLMAAGEKWFRGHYLEAVLAHAESMRPPASATGRDGDLELTIVLTPDKRYQDLWRRPPGAIQPQLVSRREFRRGQEVWALALFSGAGADADGLFKRKAQYTFVYPDGSEHGSPVGNLWWSEPPPADHLQMTEFRAAVETGDGTPPGDYLARIKACDSALQRCVTAETSFRVLAD